MCNCHKSVPKQSTGISNYLIYTPDPDCVFTEMDVITVQARLQCLKTKVKIGDYNKYLGTVNSLLNLGDYCRYDMTPIIELLDLYGC